MQNSDFDVSSGGGESKVFNKPFRSRLWILPPVILAVIALCQAVAVHRLKMDRWEGGGFAMFASIDRSSNRSFRVTVPTEEGDFPAFLNRWKTKPLRMIAIPNTGLLNSAAALLDSRDWVLFRSGESDLSHLKLDLDSVEHDAFATAYASGIPDGRSSLDIYPSFVVPAERVEKSPTAKLKGGLPRLEVYRLVYKGEGRFTSEILTSSESR